MLPSIPSTLLAVAIAVQSARAFTFSHTGLTECGNLNVKWQGGSPPFRLLLIPPGGTLRNISIPDSAYTGTAGDFSTQLLFGAGSQMILSMSDSTGVTAGGITAPQVIGGRTATVTCDINDPGADFYYSLNDPLVQCGDYPFTHYEDAVQPVTIFAFASNGDSFEVHPPVGPSYTWEAQVPAGSVMTFFMTDANGGNGGTSQIMTVEESDDTACLAALSSSSTRSSSRTSTASSSGGKPSASKDANSEDDEQDEEKSRGSKAGMIVGICAGVFVGLGAFAFVAVFCFKRKKRTNDGAPPISLGGDFAPGHNPDFAPGQNNLGSSASKTYLLPSSYNESDANLAPSQSASPYSEAAAGGAKRTSHTPAKPSGLGVATPAETAPASDFDPYAAAGVANPTAQGASSEPKVPTSPTSPTSPTTYPPQAPAVPSAAPAPVPSSPPQLAYDNFANNAPSAQSTGYPPTANVGAGLAAGAAAGAGALYGYNQYDQYQQQQQYQQHYQQPMYQQPMYGQGQYPQQQQYQQYPQQQGYGQAAQYQQTPYGQQQPMQYQPYAAPQQYQQYPQGPVQQQAPQMHYASPSIAHIPSNSTGGAMYATNADSTPATSSYAQSTVTQSSSANEKAGPPPSATPGRLILHKDIDEQMEDLPDELPPQYSESRAPIPGMMTSPPTGDRKG